MHQIRIPDEQWGPVWRALIAAGPISRISEQPIYVISNRQLRMLQRKKLPFELLEPLNGKNKARRHA
jgi:hypothetical protein